MDYCSSCRRHLNGALVCPGCGAYAPDIAPVTRAGRVAPALATPASWPEPDPGPSAELAELADPKDPEDTEGVPSAPVGRAARRRQRARWKKNQRRAVVATAVALVGGGLTVASMDRGSGDHSQASAGPDLTGMGTEEHPAAEPTDTPASPTALHTSRDGSAAPATTGGKHRRTTPTAAHTDSAYTAPYSASTPHTSTPGTQPRTTTTAGGATTTTSTGTTSNQSTSSTSSTSSSSSSSSTSTSAGDSGTSGTSSQSSSTGTSTSSGTSTNTSTASTSPSGLCVLNLICVS
ncbi:SCO2400 family protein [Streptomyces gilvus]|uniref:SCO2400 family protein n=1 Tax=Streptomyces gilvus TaxID=2920937 RepID=UPI003F8E24DF